MTIDRVYTSLGAAGRCWALLGAAGRCWALLGAVAVGVLLQTLVRAFGMAASRSPSLVSRAE